MSRRAHNDSSTSTAGVTFQGDLTRSGPSFNGHAFVVVCYVWPRARLLPGYPAIAEQPEVLS